MTELMEPQNDRDWIRWAILALGLCVAWLVFIAFFGPSLDLADRLLPPDLAGTGTGSRIPVDWDWKLRDLNNQPVSFAKFQGRTLVVNMWATWCGPCRAELPSLAALADIPRLRERGIEVVCISTDESPEELRQYVAGKPWKMTILRAIAPTSAFLSDGLPATFIVAPDGRVAATQLGPARWDDPAVIQFLESLATAKSP